MEFVKHLDSGCTTVQRAYFSVSDTRTALDILTELCEINFCGTDFCGFSSNLQKLGPQNFFKISHPQILVP